MAGSETLRAIIIPKDKHKNKLEIIVNEGVKEWERGDEGGWRKKDGKKEDREWREVQPRNKKPVTE